MKIIVIFCFVSFVSIFAMGAGEWENQVDCIGELVRINNMVSVLPTSKKREFFPLTQSRTSPKALEAKGSFKFDSGIEIRFDVTLDKKGSNWTAKNDRLITRSWLVKVNEDEKGINLYGFDERTSDIANNHFQLRTNQEQTKIIFSVNYMVNHEVYQALLENNQTEADLYDLVIQSPTIGFKTVYAANLLCRLWRPGLRP